MSICPYTSLSEVSIEVTHGCSLRCIMCSSSADYPSPLKNELSTEEIKNLIVQSRKIGAKIISFSGGEPSIRPDIHELLDTCYQNNMKVLYYTSGTMYNKDMEVVPLSMDLITHLKRIGATVIVDLQSHDPFTHDKIMGIDGTFEIALETVQTCLKLGIPIETHFVPQKLNINHIEDYVYFCQELGLEKCSFLRLVPQGRAKENYWRTMITKHQFKKMQETFLDLTMNHDLKIDIRLGHPIDRRWMIDTENKDLPIKSCRGGNDAPLFKPNGSCDMCPGWKDLPEYSAGNIRENSLSEIWLNSEFYKTFRWFVREGYKYMENECKDCEYLSKCKGGCVAQRLYELKNITDTTDMTFKDALLKAPADPMCLIS